MVGSVQDLSVQFCKLLDLNCFILSCGIFSFFNLNAITTIDLFLNRFTLFYFIISAPDITQFSPSQSFIITPPFEEDSSIFIFEIDNNHHH